jgi:hypothetical protein
MISPACFRGLGFTLTVITLLSCVGATGWQGTGNMSRNNLTEVWNYIDSNIGTYAVVEGGNHAPDLSPFSTALSAHLESLWSPAWNVFTISSLASSDSVVFGYAFNGHWMWYNGYPVNEFNLNFVIWKDYNCQGWQTVGDVIYLYPFLMSGLAIGGTASDLSSVLSTFKDSSLNVWFAASSFMNRLTETASYKGDKAFSIVMSQDSDNTRFYARVCMISSNYFYTNLIDTDNKNWGKFLFFQTR